MPHHHLQHSTPSFLTPAYTSRSHSIQVIGETHLTTTIMTFLESKRNMISRSLTISTTIPHSPGTCLHENVSPGSHAQLMIGYIETGPGLLVMCGSVWPTLEIITPGSITIITEIEGTRRFHNHNLLVENLLVISHLKNQIWVTLRRRP